MKLDELILLSGFYLIFDFTYFPAVHRGSRAKFAWCNHDREEGFEEFNCGCWGRCYRCMCLKFVGRYHWIILVNIFTFKMLFSLLDGDKPVPEAACTNYSWKVSAFHQLLCKSTWGKCFCNLSQIHSCLFVFTIIL